jgi:hypothetical protein
MAAAFGGVIGDPSVLEMAADRLCTLDAGHSHKHVIETAAMNITCTAACSEDGSADLRRMLLRAVHTSPSSIRLWTMLTRQLVHQAADAADLDDRQRLLTLSASAAECVASLADRTLPGSAASTEAYRSSNEPTSVYRVIAVLLKALSGPGSAASAHREVSKLLHLHPHMPYAWRLLRSVSK